MLTRACRFNRRIQRQNIGLEGDTVHHADNIGDTPRAIGNGLHLVHHLADDLTALIGNIRDAERQLIGLLAILGVHFHRRGQLFHAGSGFLQRSGRLFGALRQMQVAGGQLA
ncbi:hypothetical protein D3C78_1566370 [compost metagenome]